MSGVWVFVLSLFLALFLSVCLSYPLLFSSHFYLHSVLNLFLHVVDAKAINHWHSAKWGVWPPGRIHHSHILQTQSTPVVWEHVRVLHQPNLLCGSHMLRSNNTTHAVISLSSGESEFYALVNGTSVRVGTFSMVKHLRSFRQRKQQNSTSPTWCLRWSTAVRRRVGRIRHITTPTVSVQKLTQDRKVKITNIPIASNLADLETKVLDGSSIRRHVLEKCHVHIPEGLSRTALRAEVQKPRDNILSLPSLTLKHYRSQTRLKPWEGIDAEDSPWGMEGDLCNARTPGAATVVEPKHVADIEELETMDASEIYSKRLKAKEVIIPKEMENPFFQPQMDELNFLEEIRNWQHPPWCGITQFEEKVKEIFLDNQRGLFLNHLKTHFRMSVKGQMTSGPCKETS